MKIVIIAQNIIPSLTPRSTRATELAKELARLGHDVTVYALLGRYDYKSFKEETNLKIKNLGISRLGLQNSDSFAQRKILLRILNRLLGKYIEFPFLELIPMVRRVVKSEREIDYLITIAVPYTIHWAAATLTKKGHFKFWVSDCGDPFMGNPFHKHPFYFKYIEKYWCSKTNYLTVPIETAKEAYYPEFRQKIIVIPQGYSFNDIQLDDYKKNEIPTFAYSGIVYKNLRDPSLFLEFLVQAKLDFRFIVYTKSNIFKNYKELLGEKLQIRDYVPRGDLLKELSKMDFLINIKNNSGVQEPSKLIDYTLCRRPILEISSSFAEKREFEQFINGNYSRQKIVKNIEDYNIENVAKKFLILPWMQSLAIFKNY